MKMESNMVIENNGQQQPDPKALLQVEFEVFGKVQGIIEHKTKFISFQTIPELVNFILCLTDSSDFSRKSIVY